MAGIVSLGDPNRRRPTKNQKSRSKRGFTLVELLSTIAILAIIVLSVTVFIPSYISWAQNVADQRTLLVLNDALTRYKTEGGNLNALTYAVPTSHVLAAMRSPINWAGTTHQVMQTAVTYPARSIYTTGSGASYQFTGFNTYISIAGGALSHGIVAFTNVGSSTWTVPAGVTSVEVLVVAGGGGSGGGQCAGGGGGGVIDQPGFTVTPGASISITVGAGGVASGNSGTNGGDSIFGSLDAKGGGGGIYGSGPANDGGSGGGAFENGHAGGNGTPGQGYSGGSGGWNGCGYAGGGGGAGGPGGGGCSTGNGGTGLYFPQFTMGGSPAGWYGGGGAGGDGYLPGLGGAGGGGTWSAVDSRGTPNTGGGASGGGWGYCCNGGSGIVIVRY